MKSIKKFFTQEFEVQRPENSVEFGRNKKIYNKVGTFKGRFDQSTTERAVIGDKITYTVVDNLYCATDVDIKYRDKIIRPSGEEFTVLSILNPFDANNQYEIRLERVV